MSTPDNQQGGLQGLLHLVHDPIPMVHLDINSLLPQPTPLILKPVIIVLLCIIIPHNKHLLQVEQIYNRMEESVVEYTPDRALEATIFSYDLS